MRYLRIWPIEARMHSIAPKFSFVCLALLTIVYASCAGSVEAKTEQAQMCLAENIYHESRGGGIKAEYRLGMLTLARVADPHWPKTVCGVVAQNHQFSWVENYRLATNRREQGAWREAKYIAHDLLEHAWTKYRLPRGWACARWYKRTDNHDVSERSRKFFRTKLVPVGQLGPHQTAYESRHGCTDPLPTN